jgi:tRNA(fMet)-specific endonuclease VapC
LKLLDTDTCIAILRGNAAVNERRVATSDDVATTWITAAELYYGAAKSKAAAKNRALVTSFLATLPVLELDDASVRIFGEAKALLERQGRRLADAALFIGAIAVVQQATVDRERAALPAHPGRHRRELDPGLKERAPPSPPSVQPDIRSGWSMSSAWGRSRSAAGGPTPTAASMPAAP